MLKDVSGVYWRAASSLWGATLLGAIATDIWFGALKLVILAAATCRHDA